MKPNPKNEKDFMAAFRRHRRLAAMVSSAEALRAAVDTNLLQTLGRAKAATAAQLAADCELEPEAVDTILRIIQGDDLLTWDGTRFHAGPLLADDSLYLHMGLWRKTKDYLTSGQRGHFEQMRPEVYNKGVRTLARWWGPAAEVVVERLGEAGMKPPEHILDFGSGGGTWSLPFLRKYESARATGFDLPEVLPRFEQAAVEAGVAERADTVGGDYSKKLEFPRQYDLILVGMVLHLDDEAGAGSLVERLVPWLAPGGNLLIIDAFGDRAPEDANLQDLKDLATYELSLALRTEAGRPHSLASYRAMVHKAGLQERLSGLLEPYATELGILWATAH